MLGPALYRKLVALYPRDFRDHHGADLEQHFADLVRDTGTTAAWRRTAVDLLVTLPLYRLEHLMTDRHSTMALHASIATMSLAGVAGLLTGVFPGALFIALAAGLGLTQRTRLAQSIRDLDVNKRRQRFKTAAVLAGLFVASYVIFLAVIGDHWTVRATIAAVIGTTAMVGAVVFFLAALLTPRRAGA